MTLLEGDPPRAYHPSHAEPIILVPYVHGMLHEETVEAVRESGHAYTLWPLDPADPRAYAALFAEFWTKPGMLLIVEQDVVPPPHAIHKLIDCDMPWCSHAYDCNTSTPVYGLGLCRITEQVKYLHPTLGEQAAADHRGRARQQHWTSLNERVISLLNHWRYEVHLHGPRAVHLHDYGSADA